MTRPQSIVLFERLYLLAIAIEAIRICLQWRLLTQSSDGAIWTRVAAVGVSILLLLFASRRAKRGAALLLAALFAIGLPMVALAFSPETKLLNAASLAAQVVLQATAIGFMFTAASRAWFRGEGESVYLR